MNSDRVLLAMLTLGIGGWLIPNPAPSQESGKVRLFILSGQSNMSFDEKKDFGAHVQKALPKDRIVVVKHAVGGQAIWHWYKGWKPPVNAKPIAGQPDRLGATYDALLEKLSKAGVDLSSVTSVSLIWMQRGDLPGV